MEHVMCRRMHPSSLAFMKLFVFMTSCPGERREKNGMFARVPEVDHVCCMCMCAGVHSSHLHMFSEGLRGACEYESHTRPPHTHGGSYFACVIVLLVYVMWGLYIHALRLHLHGRKVYSEIDHIFRSLPPVFLPLLSSTLKP